MDMILSITALVVAVVVFFVFRSRLQGTWVSIAILSAEFVWMTLWSLADSQGRGYHVILAAIFLFSAIQQWKSRSSRGSLTA